jgi:hypothetical protein
MSTLKSPWFWLLLLALAGVVILVWRVLSERRTTIGKPLSAPPAAPPPFAANLNAVSTFASTIGSIFSDVRDG